MNWLQELAKSHPPTDEQANVYGVILYTASHANIRKVINDEEYWKAFDEKSGPRWMVFATRAEPGEYRLPDTHRDSMGLMLSVWKEPRANKKLLDEFQIDSTENLPLLMVFSDPSKGEVRRALLDLDDSSKKDAYGSIKTALGVVAKSLDKIEIEHLHKDTAYDAADLAIENHRQWENIKKGVGAFDKIKSYFSLM